MLERTGEEGTILSDTRGGGALPVENATMGGLMEKVPHGGRIASRTHLGEIE